MQYSILLFKLTPIESLPVELVISLTLKISLGVREQFYPHFVELEWEQLGNFLEVAQVLSVGGRIQTQIWLHSPRC